MAASVGTWPRAESLLGPAPCILSRPTHPAALAAGTAGAARQQKLTPLQSIFETSDILGWSADRDCAEHFCSARFVAGRIVQALRREPGGFGQVPGGGVASVSPVKGVTEAGGGINAGGARPGSGVVHRRPCTMNSLGSVGPWVGQEQPPARNASAPACAGKRFRTAVRIDWDWVSG